MQYKSNIKLIIDKRKLDLLIRIGCPDERIIELIKTGKFTPTGDKLIDETLECLIDVKAFNNWGGSREHSGRKPSKNKDINQVENQDENHLANQDTNQVVDIDKDKDINNNIINNINKKIKLKKGQFLIDYNFRIKDIPDYEIYLNEVGDKVINDVQGWLIEKKNGEVVDHEFISRQIINFSKRKGLI